MIFLLSTVCVGHRAVASVSRELHYHEAHTWEDCREAAPRGHGQQRHLKHNNNFFHKPLLVLAELLNSQIAKFWLKFSLRNHYFYISTWKCRNTRVFFRMHFYGSEQENFYRRPYQKFRINSRL